MKKILSAALVLATLLCVITLTAINASAAGASGQCGDSVYWSFDEASKTLTVSGSGEMDRQGDMKSPWYVYYNNIEKIIVSEGVTSVSESAFSRLCYAKSVTLPSTLKSIGATAFFNCRELTSVTLPEGLETIGDYAFDCCEKLDCLYFPAGVSSIGCGGVPINSMKVAPGNKYYDSRNDCNAVIRKSDDCLICGCNSTVIPDGVRSIGKYAFTRTSFSEITVPSSVASIEGYAFHNCYALPKVIYPGNKTEWGFIDIDAYGNEKLLGATVVFGNAAEPAEGWNKGPLGWYYVDKDKNAVKDQWMKDSKGWCYLTLHGYIAIDTVVADSHGLCLVDKDGYWVTAAGWHSFKHKADKYDGTFWAYVGADGYLKTNQWMKDSKGWCFLTKDGVMARDTVVADSHGFCLVDKSGYWVTTAGWHSFRDNNRYLFKYEYYSGALTFWAYSGADGYLKTNQWMKDSKGWCFLSENGVMVVNGIVADTKGLCYVDESGYWVSTPGVRHVNSDGFHLFSVWIGADGYLKTDAWYRAGDAGWAYFDRNGRAVSETFVRDKNGLCYINENGLWYNEAGPYDATVLINADGEIHPVEITVFIDSDGYVVTDGKFISARTSDYGKGYLYVDETGCVPVGKWIKDENGWFYVDGESYFVVCNGAVEDSSGLCWMGNDGYWVQTPGLIFGVRYVYVGDNGRVVTEPGFYMDKDIAFLLDEDGGVKMFSTGWVEGARGTTFISGDHCAHDGIFAVTGEDGYRLRYIGRNGYWVQTPGIVRNQDYTFCIGEDGYVIRNAAVQDQNGWLWFGELGYLVYDDICKSENGYVYVDKDGYWQKTPGFINTWDMLFCIDENGYLVFGGWVQDEKGNWLYFNDENGVAVRSGIFSSQNGLRYVDEDGYWEKTPGWHNLYDGEMRFFVKDDGYVAADCIIEYKDEGLVYVDAYGYALYGDSIIGHGGKLYLIHGGFVNTEFGIHDLAYADYESGEEYKEFENVKVAVVNGCLLRNAERSFVVAHVSMGDGQWAMIETYSFDQYGIGTLTGSYYGEFTMEEYNAFFD